MKAILKLTLIVFCTITASCNKDQQLIAKIAGEYKIESIINYKDGQGTPAVFTSGKIYFEDCAMKDGVGGTCAGWYEFDNKPRVTFQYHTIRDKSNKLINITGLSSLTEPNLSSYYEFEAEGNKLILTGEERPGSAPFPTTSINIQLSKL